MLRTTMLCLVFSLAGSVWAQMVHAQNFTIDLEILNSPNEAGELSVIGGNDIEIEFTVDDPEGELSKQDRLELYVIDGGELVTSRKRGTKLTGVVSLNAGQQYRGSYVAARYVNTGSSLEDTSLSPILILPDQSSKILFDRITDLEEALSAANDNIATLQSTANTQASEIAALQTNLGQLGSAMDTHSANPGAHHAPYGDSDVLGYLLGNGVNWSLLTSIPGDIADGDQDTQLNEAQVDVFVANNGYLTSVNWAEIGGIPVDIADGDNDTQLSETQVDSFVANNGYLTSADLPEIPGLPENLADLDALLDVDGTDIYFVGANVHLEDGSGSTDGPTNGLGNLIIGYNEEDFISGYDEQGFPIHYDGDRVRTGSHNLVVGIGQSYSSYGGFLAGKQNTISAPYASVSTASSFCASVSGGRDNIASGYHSSVSGGTHNTSTYSSSSVSAGSYNEASGIESSVSGGSHNSAAGWGSTISGGVHNSIWSDGSGATISGGANRTIRYDGGRWRGGDYFSQN